MQYPRKRCVGLTEFPLPAALGRRTEAAGHSERERRAAGGYRSKISPDPVRSEPLVQRLLDPTESRNVLLCAPENAASALLAARRWSCLTVGGLGK
jgi:hypothetical protein